LVEYLQVQVLLIAENETAVARMMPDNFIGDRTCGHFSSPPLF
jgi:hypothetical protein